MSHLKVRPPKSALGAISVAAREPQCVQKRKENADSSTRLLVGMTTSRVFQQTVKPHVAAAPPFAENAQGRRNDDGSSFSAST